MKKFLFAILLAGLVALAAAGLLGQAHTLALGAALPPSSSTAVPITSTALPPEPGIPTLVDKLYFGVPAGNGVQPQRVAIDSQRRRAYTLNYGLTARKEGNTLSVIDLQTGRVTALLKLGNMDPDASFSPSPLDLQVDPYRPRLYALWGDRYSDPSAAHLIVIDTEALTVTATLTGVEAVAPGPDRLYLAGDTRLWAVDPASLAEVAGRDLEARTYNVPLLLDVAANRLYLGRGIPWSVEVFAADSLKPAGSYTVAGEELAQATLDLANRRVLIVEKKGEQASLRALDVDGRPLDRPAPVVLPESYSDFPLAVVGKTLYVASGNFPAYRLFAYDLPDLTPQGSLPLPTVPENLTADAATGLLYGTQNLGGSSILALDPAGGPLKMIYTGLTIRSALADPAAGRLYVLDDGGTLRVLSLADYAEIARVETGFTFLDSYPTYGELSLDAGRHRLAISGDPLRIVDTASFQVTVYPGLRGQVSLDPASERVYPASAGRSSATPSS
jgi:DNA-binding beta-propeller fold protein YncE